MVQRQTRAVSREVSARKGQTRRRPITMVSTSTAIAYPYPDVLAGQRLESPASTAAWTRTSRRIPGGPSATRSGSMRLRRSQACDPRLGGSPKQRRFDTPTRYTKRASETRFRRSEALSSTWWQVKDSNLRGFRDGFTDQRWQARDQRHAYPPTNFRAYSQQTADVNRSQPDTIQAARPFPSRRTL